jgi:hypothetical protein
MSGSSTVSLARSTTNRALGQLIQLGAGLRKPFLRTSDLGNVAVPIFTGIPVEAPFPLAQTFSCQADGLPSLRMVEVVDHELLIRG